DDLLTRRDPAQDAPGVIALETGRRELIAMFGTALFHGLEARADFHAFDGIDSHHGAREVGIEPPEHRLTQARRHALGNDGDARADGIARLAQSPDELLEFRDAARIGTKKWIRIGARRILRFEHQGAHLRQKAVNAHAQTLAQELARDGARSDAHHRLARRGAPAASIVAKAVFLLIGVIRMART